MVIPDTLIIPQKYKNRLSFSSMGRAKLIDKPATNPMLRKIHTFFPTIYFLNY